MCTVSVSNKDISWTHSAWDPTEPIATRPLFTTGSGNRKFFYTCDGNKNVSEMVHFEQRNGIAAHYDYAPFGAVTRAISASAVADNTFTTDNPFRFSSEYHDDTLGLVYYRERERTFHGHYWHYNPIDGRWVLTDLLSFYSDYNFLNNSPIYKIDFLGNIDSLFVLSLPPLSLDRNTLLRKRHGEDARFRNHPIAFTRPNVIVSFSCYCDDFDILEGEITATLYIHTYIYEESDQVVIKSNNENATREDVLAHEKEHARDCETSFYQAFNNRQDKRFYMTREECEQSMRVEVSRLKQEFYDKIQHYAQNEHSIPKFQRGGDYFVEGNYL